MHERKKFLSVIAVRYNWPKLLDVHIILSTDRIEVVFFKSNNNNEYRITYANQIKDNHALEVQQYERGVD